MLMRRFSCPRPRLWQTRTWSTLHTVFYSGGFLNYATYATQRKMLRMIIRKQRRVWPIIWRRFTWQVLRCVRCVSRFPYFTQRTQRKTLRCVRCVVKETAPLKVRRVKVRSGQTTGGILASLDPAALLRIWRNVMGHCSAEKRKTCFHMLHRARMSESSISLKTTSHWFLPLVRERGTETGHCNGDHYGLGIAKSFDLVISRRVALMSLFTGYEDVETVVLRVNWLTAFQCTLNFMHHIVTYPMQILSQ